MNGKPRRSHRTGEHAIKARGHGKIREDEGPQETQRDETPPIPGRIQRTYLAKSAIYSSSRGIFNSTPFPSQIPPAVTRNHDPQKRRNSNERLWGAGSEAGLC